MATGIILAGGASTRMPGDKAFMELSGRPVIEIQLEVLDGLFEEIFIVSNEARVGRLSAYGGGAVKVVEEPVGGKGPLGGILSGLVLSRTDDNFVVACDMPFIKREAVSFVVSCLSGYQVAVPRTSKGLEPLHAAYDRSCAPVIERQLDEGDLKVTGFYDRVEVREISAEELERFDPSGRLLLNINSPDDMRQAAGVARERDSSLSRVGGAQMPEEISREVIQAVKREAVDDKMPCARAQALAAELGVPMKEVGRALDFLNIKIINCQLGCF